MSENGKSNDGTYVVLQVNEADPELTAYTLVGITKAHRPEEALKKVYGVESEQGKYVVVPQKSWRTFEAVPTTVVQVKAVE